VVALQQQNFQTNLFYNNLTNRYKYDMMRYVLNQSVVCGNEKNCYQSSCFTRANGKKGIRGFDVDIALNYDYLYYSTTFKRNGIDKSEIIKCFIIDVDYRPVEDIDVMHQLISDKVLAPTFTTKTDKGYQFMYALSSAFILSAKGEKYARALNGALMNKFAEADIEIDLGASSRLTSTYRNPLTHVNRFNNLTYSVDVLKKKLDLDIQTYNKFNVKSPKKDFSGISGRVENKNESSAKYEAQKKILNDGFIDGNRNQYFYLLANKECVLQNIQSYNDSLMVCNMVADNLSIQNPNVNKIPNCEVEATAKQLHRYASDNSLYMPTVFYSDKKDINNGKYRNELNATVGYCDLTLRRSAAMEMVQRDRKANTLKIIKEAINKLCVDDYISFYAVVQKVALLSDLSISTVKRYIKDNKHFLSSPLRLKKKNVLDFMNLLKIGVLADDEVKSDKKSVVNMTNEQSCNNIEYINITDDENCNKKGCESDFKEGRQIIFDKWLCMSDATDEEIEYYEMMGWDIMPF